MKSPKSCVLTINGGSSSGDLSSITFASFQSGSSSVRALDGKIEGIGLPTGRFNLRGATEADVFRRSVAVPDRGAQRGGGGRDLDRRQPGHGARHAHRRRADDRAIRLSHSWALR